MPDTNALSAHSTTCVGRCGGGGNILLPCDASAATNKKMWNILSNASERFSIRALRQKAAHVPMIHLPMTLFGLLSRRWTAQGEGGEQRQRLYANRSSRSYWPSARNKSTNLCAPKPIKWKSSSMPQLICFNLLPKYERCWPPEPTTFSAHFACKTNERRSIARNACQRAIPSSMDCAVRQFGCLGFCASNFW